MKKQSPNILFAIPSDDRRIDELWSQYSQNRAKELGFNVRLVADAEPIDCKRWADLLHKVDAVITSWSSPQLNETVLSRNDTLKIMGHAGGTVADTVSDELYRRGVKVVTANDIMARSVAEWCLSMTLVGRRNFLAYTQFGNHTSVDWRRQEEARGLQTAVVGIWGFGAVARHLLRYLQPLEPKEILVHSSHLSNKDAVAKGMKKVGFDELFEKSDVIHLLTSLTDRSRNKVGPEQLALIMDRAVLINVGRGQLIQEQALLNELKKQRFTAILDVFHKEPLPDSSPLRQLSNVILTPHNGGRPSRRMLAATVLEEFERFFRGKPLKYEISQQRVTTMTSQRNKKFANQGKHK